MNRPNKKVVKNILIVTLGALGLLGLISGIILWLVTSPVSTDEWNVHPLNVSDDSADILDGKIEKLRRDIENASVGDVLVLRVTEEEATSGLDRFIRQRNVSVETYVPEVYFGNGTVLVLARLHIGVYMKTIVQIAVSAKDGKVDFTVKRFDLGRLTVPKTLVNNIMTAVEHEVGGRWDELPVEVEDVSIGGGVMSVRLVKK